MELSQPQIMNSLQQNINQSAEALKSTINTMFPLPGNEIFYNRTLQDLMKNEENINQYFSKRVLVTATHAQLGKYRCRGEFHCCLTDGWVLFDLTSYDIHPNPEFLTGTMSASFGRGIIDDIILIEHEPEDYVYNPQQDEKDNDNNKDGLILGKSIKNEVYDHSRYKVIQYALYQMNGNQNHLYPELEPFDIKYRKQYLKKNTESSIKQEIGDKIINMKLPETLDQDPLFTMNLFQPAIYDQESILQRNGTLNYHLPDALSLLHDFHQLWIQYINYNTCKLKVDENKEETKEEDAKQDDSKEDGEKDNKPTFNTTYLIWDDWEIEKKPLMPFNPNADKIVLDSSDLTEPAIYSQKPIIDLTKIESKSKHIYIDTIWPYDFTGPCCKYLKNEPDWICMKCKSKSEMPFLPPIAVQYENRKKKKDEEDEKKIWFYKSRRTDVNIQICHKCVSMHNSLKNGQKTLRKTRKFQQV